MLIVKNKADWPIAGQEEIELQSQTSRILGRERAQSGVTSQMQRKEVENVLRKVTKARG